MNKFKLRISNTTKNLDFPLSLDFNHYGQDDDIDIFQEKTKLEIVGTPTDYDINRFAHSAYTSSLGFLETSINYQFYFYDSITYGPSNFIAAAWSNSYITSNTFTDREIYYNSNPFTKSFFKIDLYDTPDERSQQIYMTIIIPTQQGTEEFLATSTFSTAITNFNVKKPNFILDSVGADKEGYYLYWLRNKNVININTFYMSIKFFNARTGQFVRMMKQGQFSFFGSYYNFPPEKYFYDKVVIDFENQVYSVIDVTTNARIDNGTPIKWYQYLNQQ